MFELDDEARKFGVTCVENAFIRDYMPAAKGEYVKVFLAALLHASCGGEDADAEMIAGELDITVNEAESALRYWERRGLVTLETLSPLRCVFHSAAARSLKKHDDPVDESYVDFAESVYAAFGSQRKVRPSEIARAWEWVQDIGLSAEAVLLLINHCIATMHSQFSFKKAETLAVAMKESGAVAPDDAEAFLRNDLNTHEGAKAVLRKLGRRGRLPSDAELDLYRKWRQEWEFSHDAILEACSETTKGEPTFAYLDGILGGIRKRADARTGSGVKETLLAEKDEAGKAAEITSGLRPAVSKQVAVNLYRAWRKTFPHDVLRIASAECVRYGGGAEDLAMLLSSWESRGLTDKAAVEEYLAHFRSVNADLKKIFEICGYTAKPTAADREWYDRKRAAGIDMEMLMYAAEKTRGVQGNKIAYMETILKTWSEEGIRNLAQARAEKKPMAKPGKTVNAQRYTQRDYTEEELAGASEELMKEAMEENHG